MLREAGVELVVLAGFMRVLKTPMLEAFPMRIINIHPSLLPKFPGLEAWKQALAANEKATGCTVHYVDPGIDHGAVIAQREVPIVPNDTADSLHARIQIAEHDLYPEVIANFCCDRGLSQILSAF
jgi:phosphoribosylglycinamide formyltransferase-1